MRTIQLIIGNKEKTYTGPSTWSEVPEAMALKLFNLVKAGATKKHLLWAVPMLVYKIPLSVMQMFLDTRKAYRKFEAAADPDNHESLALIGDQILSSCQWVYNEQPPTRWLLKCINVNGKYFDVTDDRLTGFTFKQFIFSELYAGTDLAKLAAVLYTKRSWGLSGKRQGFDHEDVLKQSLKLSGDQFNDVRNLIAWNYAGMVQHLKNTFPLVFESPSGQDSPAAASTSPWMDTALVFTDNDSVRFHALEQESLYVALKMINNRIKQNKELEAKYKK